MSLLEDIFLRDEAHEAEELERIIEGDEYDDRPQNRSDSDDDSVKDNEAEEEKKRVDPSSTKNKRSVRNPRVLLNPARLTGPRGIQVIPEHFKDFKFKGKGHEKEDLDLVLKKLEHWAYRLYPKFQFEDCLKKIETLGKKRPVMVHLHKIRSDQYNTEETVVQKDSSDDETAPAEKEEDEFDKLLQQQIELARSTPGPGSVKKTVTESSVINSTTLTAPRATSSPSISEEQRERMMRSRKLAEEKRLARLKNATAIRTNSASDDKESIKTYTNEESNNQYGDDYSKVVEENQVVEDNIVPTRKHNRSNVLDSSDDEDEIMSVNESIRVDIHTSVSANNLGAEKFAKTGSATGKIIDIDDGIHIDTYIESVNDKNESLESQDKLTTNHQPKELLETCEESVENDNDSNVVNCEETKTTIVDGVIIYNEEIHKQNSFTENEIGDKIADASVTSESIEELKTSKIGETNENVSPSENMVNLYGKEGTGNENIESKILKVNESDKNKEVNTPEAELNKDLDDLMDVDLTDDF